MKNTHPENSKQYTGGLGQITAQRGFFTISLGLGLSAVFALFGATLAPEQEIHQANSQVEIQAMAFNSQRLQMPAEMYPGQHQF